MPNLLVKNDKCEIWQGDSLDQSHVEEILDGRKVNSLIFDAPYSEKVHEGHKNGKLTADRAAAFAKAHENNPTAESRYSARKSAAGESGRRDLEYEAFDEEKINKFCSIWLPKTTGWVVSITDDVLAPVWGAEFEAADRYRFAPLPLVETGSRVRMVGDGPSNWTCWIVVARPKNREYASWGTLPGAYVQAAERKFNSSDGSDRIVGAKPLKSMIRIVDDYTRPNDIVCDMFLGGGTTGRACLRSQRYFIGIEKDAARARLSAEILAAESKMSTRKATQNGQQALFKG